MIHFHKHPYTKGWYYLGVAKWQPFARFGAGGWILLNWSWLCAHWNTGKVPFYVDTVR